MPDFKLGKLPGRIPVGLRDLTYYAAGHLPAAPARSPSPQSRTGTWTGTQITVTAASPA